MGDVIRPPQWTSDAAKRREMERKRIHTAGVWDAHQRRRPTLGELLGDEPRSGPGGGRAA